MIGPSVQIAGRRVPVLVFAVAGVLGMLLVLRARRKGANVVAVGTAPAAFAPDLTGLSGLSSSGADLSSMSAAIANMQNQLNGATLPVTTPSPATSPATSTPDWFTSWLSTNKAVAAPAAVAAAVLPATPAPAPAAQRSYTVVHGDTLWGIAQRFYGNGGAYPQIARANGIANPNLIYAGQTVRIP